MQEIHLSPTGIKDFLSCSMRLAYRIAFKKEGEEGEKTEKMKIGLAVHETIEEAWRIPDPAVNLKYLNKYNLVEKKSVDKVKRSLSNYYQFYAQMLTERDVTERLFEYQFAKGITIVGKMDRVILERDTVIDWKTGDWLQKSIDDDIQFMLYYMGYKKLYGREPKNVLYINVNKNIVLRFKYEARNFRVLEKDIIPKVTRALRTGDFHREGMFTGVCGNCPYKTVCWREA